MNLTEHELVRRYRDGEALTVLAMKAGVRHQKLRALFEALDVPIRTHAEAHRISHVAAEHEPLGVPPKPKLCTYGCGRLSTSWTSHACLSCALYPPCTCPPRLVYQGKERRPRTTCSGSFHFGKEKCGFCGLLIGGAR